MIESAARELAVDAMSDGGRFASYASNFKIARVSGVQAPRRFEAVPPLTIPELVVATWPGTG